MTIQTPHRVLFVSSFLPYPLDRGDPVRVHMLLKAIASRFAVTVLTCDRETTTADDVKALSNSVPSAEFLSFRPRGIARGRARKLIRWIHACVRRTPVWILNRESAALRQTLRSLVGQFDLVFLAGEAAACYVDLVKSPTPSHWDKSNVIGVSSRKDIAESSNKMHHGQLQITHWLSKSYERRVLRRVRTVSVTSTKEAERLSSLYARRASFIWPSGVETRKNLSSPNYRSHKVLWLGSLDYHSNLVGLRRLINESRTIAAETSTTLVVVGAGGDTDFIDFLRNQPFVEYRGFVEDLTTVVPEVRCGIVPIWSGAGIKLKTLTLMQLGVPIVSTDIGMEGIPYNTAVLVTSSASQLMRTAATAPHSVLDRARRAALEQITSNFSAEAIAELVDVDLREILHDS